METVNSNRSILPFINSMETFLDFPFGQKYINCWIFKFLRIFMFLKWTRHNVFLINIWFLCFHAFHYDFVCSALWKMLLWLKISASNFSYLVSCCFFCLIYLFYYWVILNFENSIYILYGFIFFILPLPNYFYIFYLNIFLFLIVHVFARQYFHSIIWYSFVF